MAWSNDEISELSHRDVEVRVNWGMKWTSDFDRGKERKAFWEGSLTGDEFKYKGNNWCENGWYILWWYII